MSVPRVCVTIVWWPGKAFCIIRRPLTGIISMMLKSDNSASTLSDIDLLHKTTLQPQPSQNKNNMGLALDSQHCLPLNVLPNADCTLDTTPLSQDTPSIAQFKTRAILKTYTSFEDAVKKDPAILKPITSFDGNFYTFPQTPLSVSFVSPFPPADSELRAPPSLPKDIPAPHPSPIIPSKSPSSSLSLPDLSTALIKRSRAVQQREKDRRLRQGRLLLVSLLEVHNGGNVFRSARKFGVERVLLTGNGPAKSIIGVGEFLPPGIRYDGGVYDENFPRFGLLQVGVHLKDLHLQLNFDSHGNVYEFDDTSQIMVNLPIIVVSAFRTSAPCMMNHRNETRSFFI